MSRVIVLGAGVLGASVAYHLAVAGAQVVVIEAGGPAAGTSSATFSMDVTHLKTPRTYYELNRASAARHATLAEELGGPSWWHPMPAIQWGDSEESQAGLRERAVRLKSWGHPCHIADPSELRELAPAVDPAACTASELVIHDQSAWYDAPLFVQRLLDRAATLGADIRYGLRAHALIRRGDTVTGVETGAETGTRRWEADWVVNCTGPDADRIAALAGTDLPMTRIPGLVGESTPIPGLRLDAILATPQVDLRPAPGDRICSISWPVDALLSGQSDDALAERLHASGQRILPALRTARLAGVRLGVRPVPADGLPLAGTHPDAPGLYHLVTHSGVNLAPELGRLVAQEITNGDGPDLARYRVTRDIATSVKDESLTLMTTS